MKFKLLNWPNGVTLLRIALLYVLVVLVYHQSLIARLFAAGLAVLLIIMDWLDGFLARKLNSSTTLGSVLDIAGDRLVESVLWICLADLRLIPVWIPIVVISRSVFTDSIRGYTMQYGYTAFGKKTMMQSRLGRFLTGSPIMRTGYAILKATSFGLLLLGLAFRRMGVLPASFVDNGLLLGHWIAVLTAVICLVRGIPVIVEGVRLIQEREMQSE